MIKVNIYCHRLLILLFPLLLPGLILLFAKSFLSKHFLYPFTNLITLPSTFPISLLTIFYFEIVSLSQHHKMTIKLDAAAVTTQQATL